MTDTILGWDVGGAHLKLAVLSGGGRLLDARITPCPLWSGLDALDAAIAELGEIPIGRNAVTMTGELVDLFEDRASGVAALAGRMAGRLDAETAFYAGARGFIDASQAADHWRDVASANWRATAESLAQDDDGLLLDIGSTTTDVAPFASGRVTARGANDAERLACEELVYLGVARTPVMAIVPRLPFGGAWVSPMAELFAASADVFRLTGDLPEGADLHPAADGGPKTSEASARRLLRMVGADYSPDAEVQARKLAAWIAEAVLRRLADAAEVVLSRPECGSAPTLFGAGVGRFLAAGVAERLGLLYRDVGAAWADDPALAAAAADCAPAVAVGRLLALRR